MLLQALLLLGASLVVCAFAAALQCHLTFGHKITQLTSNVNLPDLLKLVRHQHQKCWLRFQTLHWTTGRPTVCRQLAFSQQELEGSTLQMCKCQVEPCQVVLPPATCCSGNVVLQQRFEHNSKHTDTATATYTNQQIAYLFLSFDLISAPDA